MKRLAVGLLASLMPLAMAPGTASAQGVGDFYWGVFGGVQFFGDNEIDNADLEFEPGFSVGGQLGYIFGSVRAEAEIEYSEADVDEFANQNSGAELSVLRGTGSLYFDFIGFGRTNILPYAGGGFGLASTELDGGSGLDDDEVSVTAHGEIGVSFATTRNLDVVFAYRFEWFDSDLEDIDDDIISNQVRAGIRFFTGPGCC